MTAAKTTLAVGLLVAGAAATLLAGAAGCGAAGDGVPAISDAQGPALTGERGTTVLAAPPASTASAADDRFRVSAAGAFLYGPVRGSIQTPSGGRPGTTSPNRPSFKEIGIDDAGIADASATFAVGDGSIAVGARFIGMSGSGTLRDPLVSQGQTFDAGTRVRSDVTLDWYRAGYEQTFVAVRGDGGRPELTLTPSAGAGVFSLDYELRQDGAGGPRVSRSTSKVMPQVGLGVEWRPGGGPLSVSAEALGFPRIGTAIPQVTAEQVLLHYRVVDGRVAADVFGGVAFEQVEFEDNQRVPNHLRADFGPMLVVGLALRF